MRHVLITGSSSGMGKESARYLAKRGFVVYAGSRTPQVLETIAQENLIPFYLDLRDSQKIQEALGSIERIDVLINNAGYGLVSSVEDVTEEQMLAQFEINLFGALRVTKAVIPKMRAQQSGVIINISSFLGKVGLPLLTFYNASKYALEGVTDSLRYELRDFGIRVHSILPGFFATNFAKENLVINQQTFCKSSAYEKFTQELAPKILDQINHGNDPLWVAQTILEIIENPDAPARMSAGEKAKKFIPMRRELSDEDFEKRVRIYYGF